ncbi:MAG: hypothetical protein ACREL7_03190 [Longimicrobiales bacterium]
MSDESARPTPWDVAFADASYNAELFPAIAQEARERNIDPRNPDGFLLLSSAGSVARRLSPDAGDLTGQPSGPPLDAVRLYSALVFHAFHFWQEGNTIVCLDDDVTRTILAHRPAIGAWRLTPPARAGYLQLPRNLLWARVTDEPHAEPADGLFWTAIETQALPLSSAVALLVVLGLRPGRPGFSVMDAIASPPHPPGHWGDAQARADGKDFANILPGGELSNLFGLVNVAELFKFVSRAFHFLAHAGQVDTE